MIYTVPVPGQVEDTWNAFVDDIEEWWSADHRLVEKPNTIRIVPGQGIEVQHLLGPALTIARIVKWEPPHKMCLHFFAHSSPEKPYFVNLEMVPFEDKTGVTLEFEPGKMTEQEFESLMLPIEKLWLRVFTSFVEFRKDCNESVG